MISGERRSITFHLRVYTATELAKLLAEIGFSEIDCFGDFEGAQRVLFDNENGAPALVQIDEQIEHHVHHRGRMTS